MNDDGDGGDGPCDRFARDGALALERGQLDEGHLATCAACRDARDGYLRVTRAVTAAAAGIEPPPGWEVAVRGRIASRRARRRAGWIGGGAALAAAVVATILLVGRREVPHIALHIEVTPGQGARAGSLRPGDTMLLDARIDPARHAELRVYTLGGYESVVLRCAADDAHAETCTRTGDQLRARLVVPTRGRYRAVLFIGARDALPSAGRAPIAPRDGSGASTAQPSTSLDRDVATARAAGAIAVLSEVFEAH